MRISVNQNEVCAKSVSEKRKRRIIFVIIIITIITIITIIIFGATMQNKNGTWYKGAKALTAALYNI